MSCAAAIGMFDGVHLGHRALIAELRLLAAERGLTSHAFTFDRHPMQVVAPHKAPQLLTTPSQRCRLLVEAGADCASILVFDEAMRQRDARQFLSLMHDEHGVEMLLVGFDHRFGKDRAGDFETYRCIGRELGIEVLASREKVEITTPEGLLGVSSSAIRHALRQGNLALANRMLGRRYGFAGRVEHGRNIGHTIGFPTANVVPEMEQQLVPAQGVYAAVAKLNASPNAQIEPEAGVCEPNSMPDKPNMTVVPAMVNIGRRPTIEGRYDAPMSIEAHLIGIDRDLYGESLSLEFAAYLRPECRFDSIEDLASQLALDRQATLAALAM